MRDIVSRLWVGDSDVGFRAACMSAENTVNMSCFFQRINIRKWAHWKNAEENGRVSAHFAANVVERRQSLTASATQMPVFSRPRSCHALTLPFRSSND